MKTGKPLSRWVGYGKDDADCGRRWIGDFIKHYERQEKEKRWGYLHGRRYQMHGGRRKSLHQINDYR